MSIVFAYIGVSIVLFLVSRFVVVVHVDAVNVADVVLADADVDVATAPAALLLLLFLMSLLMPQLLLTLFLMLM
jgi:hypothetical protein